MFSPVRIFLIFGFRLNRKCPLIALAISPNPTPNLGDTGGKWINRLWLNLQTDMDYICGIRYGDLDQRKTVRLNNSHVAHEVSLSGLDLFRV
jgi:hypothetical protein